ncbi:VWA domain-containing protein [Lysinibacillus sp. KU-BSD001]|uniref:VWA domain-containing protein n=1 Tax=Lysinibacillus sp. KU-BSD001 TaxID=3141328 RepID=UPI0036DFA83D
MKNLIRGEKVKLSDYTSNNRLEVEIQIESNFEIDITCFGLDANKQLTDDRYMIFYNQLLSPLNEIRLHSSGNGIGTFSIDLSKLPSTIQSLVFTATIDGNGTMGIIHSGSIIIKTNGQPILNYALKPTDFKNEKAIIITEMYYKSLWRVAAVGQGFDGGLAALLTSFGGVAEEEQGTITQPQSVAPAATITDKKVMLEKRLEKEAPKLLDLSKKAQISLEKVGLQHHNAKVALCLDISGSMAHLYRSGKIQNFAERILALGTRFDDDGSIDIFLFGKNAHDTGELTISNFNGFVNHLIREYPLETSTYYAKAMKAIRQHYFGSAQNRKQPLSQNVPIYVMFVTDGDTFDKEETTKHIQESSYEPIFWQFMAIGESNKDVKKGFFKSLFQSDFTFLEQLDNLPGRYIDNADFFSVKDPSAISDNELYDLLMQEYPDWVKAAKGKALI